MQLTYPYDFVTFWPLSFSNRVFIDKAVAGWTGKSDIDHIERVGRYIHGANQLPPARDSKVFDENSLTASDITMGRDAGDPLYAVTVKVQ